tara:strand:- start:202 stop:510 length:309 start_codon:yes stop_codon:yes gene_type:complete
MSPQTMMNRPRPCKAEKDWALKITWLNGAHISQARQDCTRNIVKKLCHQKCSRFLSLIAAYRWSSSWPSLLKNRCRKRRDAQAQIKREKTIARVNTSSAEAT